MQTAILVALILLAAFAKSAPTTDTWTEGMHQILRATSAAQIKSVPAEPDYCKTMDVPELDELGYQYSDQFFWQPNATKLVPTRINGNTYGIIATQAPYVATAPTSGGLIITDDGVVLVEGYLNMFLACQVKRIVEKLAPGKPVKYLINTGKHGDHTFGNGVFFNPEIHYVQHEWTKHFLDTELLSDEIPFMEYFMGSTEIGIRTAAQLRSQTDGTGLTEPSLALNQSQYPYTLTLGSTAIVIHNWGFQQTFGDQIVWVPADKTLFTGNPISGPDPELNILLDGNIEASLATTERMLAWMKEQDPTWAAGSKYWIQPGHSSPFQDCVATIQYQVDYLSLLVAAVQDQIADGSDLQATCSAVTWWSLNVPEGPHAPYDVAHQDWMFAILSHFLNLEHLYSELTGLEYSKCACPNATSTKGRTC
jgi:glyoxylase-like metal-dependent hydrolase (beta-lactamase superfamily II)